MKIRLLFGSALLSCALPASAQLVYDGVFLDRANKYDAYPTHLFSDGLHHLWFCGLATSGSDAIFYTSKSGSFGNAGWSNPVQVFDRVTSPWADHHVCDPSVAIGDFNYDGNAYRYALYYTADDNSLPVGVNGQIGLAFSTNGTAWTAYPTPVISTTNAFNGTYGAGASGIAWALGDEVLHHIYNDTTVPGPFPAVWKETTDGINYTPVTARPTQIDEAAGFGYGSAPDIAFSPLEGVWYATVSNPSPNGVGLGEVRILRSQTSLLSSAWDMIYLIDASITGEVVQHNAGLAKNGDSTL